MLPLGAWAAASGLAVRFLALPETMEDRLPFGARRSAASHLRSSWLSPHRFSLRSPGVAPGCCTPRCWTECCSWAAPWSRLPSSAGSACCTRPALAVAAGLVLCGRGAIPDLLSSAPGSSRDVQELALWRPVVAYALLTFAAVGYAVVALLLDLAGALAMPEP
jgi:hypothetical protein